MRSTDCVPVLVRDFSREFTERTVGRDKIQGSMDRAMASRTGLSCVLACPHKVSRAHHACVLLGFLIAVAKHLPETTQERKGSLLHGFREFSPRRSWVLTMFG